MTQEEIIALAKASLKKDVIYHRDGIELEWDDLIDFFHAAQCQAYERAAEVLERAKVEITKLTAERDAARAEVKEYRTDELNYRSQVITLKAERDAAFAMSRCECESNEACKNLVALHDEVERLKQERDAALDEIDELARKAREGTAQAIRQANEITTLKSALREAKH